MTGAGLRTLLRNALPEQGAADGTGDMLFIGVGTSFDGPLTLVTTVVRARACDTMRDIHCTAFIADVLYRFAACPTGFPVFFVPRPPLARTMPCGGQGPNRGEMLR